MAERMLVSTSGNGCLSPEASVRAESSQPNVLYALKFASGSCIDVGCCACEAQPAASTMLASASQTGAGNRRSGRFNAESMAIPPVGAGPADAMLRSINPFDRAGRTGGLPDL